MRFLLSSKKKIAAVSLLEVMIAVAISSLLFATIMALGSYTVRSFAAITNYAALDRASRKALDRLTMMIREADGVLAFNTNRLALSYHGGTLIYRYEADEKVLLETFAGETTTLLEGCDSFTFGIFQRNIEGGNYGYYPAALDESEAKIVQMSWICSRKLISDLINTESIQSAKVVIRK
jgi:hypothetical protein